MLELIMFVTTIALAVAVIKQYKDKNKFGLIYSIVAFVSFLAVDFAIITEWLAKSAS